MVLILTRYNTMNRVQNESDRVCLETHAVAIYMQVALKPPSDLFFILSRLHRVRLRHRSPLRFDRGFRAVSETVLTMCARRCNRWSVLRTIRFRLRKKLGRLIQQANNMVPSLNLKTNTLRLKNHCVCFVILAFWLAYCVPSQIMR